MYTSVMHTPIGALTICSSATAITALRFGVYREEDGRDLPLHQACQQQLEEYFMGRRKVFDLPLAPEGTPFQQEVWALLRTIPYGSTLSYGQVAAALSG